jgi:hypothetical protein
VIDSTGKFPSGLLDFTYIDFGEYDQCLAIKSSPKENQDPVFGKYCLTSILPNALLNKPYQHNVWNMGQKYRLKEFENKTIDQSLDQYFDPKTNVTLLLGFCIPSQCSENDLDILLNSGNCFF